MSVLQKQDNLKLIKQFRQTIPILSNKLYKGQNGKIGIVGGSYEYSGAPYFAAISSLRVGADLSYVLTTPEAAPIIKGYSPELIVIPILGIADSETLMDTWISRVHSLIIGPGLGRSENAFKSVKIALACAKKQNIPVTIDADGLYVLSFDTSLIKGYEKCILTPNAIEFKRIYDSEFKNEAEYDENKNFSNIELQCEAVQRLAKKLENVTIFKKGAVDIISDGRKVILSGMDSNGEYTNEGMPKRCGGIGDLLSGTIGTFSYWSSNYAKSNEEENEQINSNLIACFSASRFIKACSKVAFEKCHRSVLAVDIIEEIGNVFFNIYDATK